MTLREIPDYAIFAEDVKTLDQELLIRAGGEMSPAVRMRLQNYIQTSTLRDSFRIQVAAGKPQAQVASAPQRRLTSRRNCPTGLCRDGYGSPLNQPVTSQLF